MTAMKHHLRQQRRFPGTPGAFARAIAAFAVAVAAHADSDPERLSALFAANCAQCHVRPETKAPQMGVAADWAQRVKQGEAALMRHVVEGLAAMPPLGYCSACTEDELRALTRMLAGVQALPP
jgi:cytochrome c5